MDFREFATKETPAFIERLTAAAAAQAEDARQRVRDDAQKTIDKLETSLKELRAQEETLRTKLQTAETTREQEARAKADAERDLQKIRAAVEEHERVRHELEAKLEKAGQQLEKAGQQIEKAEKDIERVRAEAEAAAQASAQASALREQMARAAPQPLDRLLGVFEHLATATTVGDVLTAVVHGLATEFSRVAAFSVGGNHLEGLHQVGFDFKSDISKIVIPMTVDSLLTQAATSGRVEGFLGSEIDESRCAPFGGTPAFVLTLPIQVRGVTLAVIYADSTDQQQTSGAAHRGVKFAEFLLWHAVPMLSKLSNDQEETVELRKYATLLLNEIESMYEADASEGMDAEDLKSRLKDNLDCARRLYAQRVTSDGVPIAAPLLDEQLVALVAAKASTQFGQDLAGLTRRQEPASRKGPRRRAEAS